MNVPNTLPWLFLREGLGDLLGKIGEIGESAVCPWGDPTLAWPRSLQL